METIRLDKWLWAARFFKTRAQAKTAIEGGKVHLNGLRSKAAKDVRVGDELRISRGAIAQTVHVREISEQRGPAARAAELYEETEASVHARETERARRKMERAGLTVPKVRPTKKGRRELLRLKSRSASDPAVSDE